MTQSIQLNTLWHRHTGCFQNLVYEVVGYDAGIVKYRIFRKDQIHDIAEDIFLRDFEMLGVDEVIKVTGGIF